LPGGPIGPPARRATTSNVEVGQSTSAYPAYIRRVEREGREGGQRRQRGTKSQREREGSREWNGEWARDP